MYGRDADWRVMKFIDKLERKFGRYGIENLTMYIIISYVLGYALMYIESRCTVNAEPECYEDPAGTDLETDHLGYLSTEHVIYLSGL